MPDIVTILLCLLLTIGIEFLSLWFLKVRDIRLWGSIIINVVTNVSLNLFLIYVIKKMPIDDILYVLILVGLEVVIIIVEGLLYQIFKKDIKNFLYSAIANGISATLGTLIVYLISLIL